MSSSPNKWRCVRCKFLYLDQAVPTVCTVCSGRQFRPVVDVVKLPDSDHVESDEPPAPGACAA